MLGIARLLLDQQHPALLVAVEGICGGEQASTLDQPWLEIRIDVENEYQVLIFEIAADRRMMSDAGPKYSLPAEIYDVTSARIVRAA